MGKNIVTTPTSAYNHFDLEINKKYATTYSQIFNLRDFLNRQELSQSYLYNNQSEYLVSVRAYPFWCQQFFNSVGAYGAFPIGPFSSSETGVSGKLLSDQFTPLLIDSIAISRYFNDFMDYEPYTKIKAYLPYLGYVSLDTNEIMGSTVYFYCQVDFDNGLLTYFLVKDSTMIQSWECHVGVDISLNRTNNSEIVRNMYLWGISAVTGTGSLMMSGNNIRAMREAGHIASGYINANQHHVSRGSISSGVNKLYEPTSIFLIIEREQPNFTTLTDYAHINGLPLNETKDLSTLTGYTEIGDIQFNPMGYDIYQNEINEIIDLLKTGVIL